MPLPSSGFSLIVSGVSAGPISDGVESDCGEGTAGADRKASLPTAKLTAGRLCRCRREAALPTSPSDFRGISGPKGRIPVVIDGPGRHADGGLFDYLDEAALRSFDGATP